MRKLRDEFQDLPRETKARLGEFCTNASEIITCMNFVGLGELRNQLTDLKKNSQHPEVLYIQEVFDYFEQNNIRIEPYTQIMLNLELLYIRFYMINEIILKHKKFPKLNIKDLKTFRLVFTHASTPSVFYGPEIFVYYVNWIKPDLSEISYRFFKFDGSNERDIVMFQKENVQAFQDWYNSVYEEIA